MILNLLIRTERKNIIFVYLVIVYLVVLRGKNEFFYFFFILNLVYLINKKIRILSCKIIISIVLDEILANNNIM